MSIFYANLFFPIEPPRMISAGSYELFVSEVLHRILCKSLVKKHSLISCVHPSIWGVGDAVSEVTTSMRTASSFLNVWFGFFFCWLVPI